MPTAMILKFDFYAHNEYSFILRMPLNAKIIKAELQNGTPCMWAIIPEGDHPMERKFIVYGTGEVINEVEHLEYISSFQDGIYVWHLFEVI